MPWRRLLFVLLLTVGCDDSDPVASCEVPHPDCARLCDDLCARFAECSTPGATTCASECESKNLCGGETPDQDGAICRNQRAMNQNLTCAELCGRNAFGQDCR